MGRFRQIAGLESSEKYTPIQADPELFQELQEEIPSEPMVQLQPQKDGPGLEAGMDLVKSLYHYRKDKYGRNVSPINSFEIWFDDGEIRFYFHPDTREQKNSGMKHFEDKYPGTRMQEEGQPFPQIDEDDYIAGARMTLTHDFERPIRMPEGPSSFKRDPFGDLTSDMVVENERTKAGERVRSEDVRMVVQVLFQPASRKTSHGGLFGKDFNDYADELKKPVEKSGWDQVARIACGLQPQTREPTAKMKKTAKIISELRGEPEFFFRLRVICISPYREMAKQHVDRVVEVFETYHNPVTEQGLQPIPKQGEMLRDMLRKMAGREMCYSTIAKMFSGKDLLSVPELAGLVHLPNESIETPEVNWTNLEKGSGVPTTTPDLNEVDEQIHTKQAEAAASAEEESDDSATRMREISEEDLEASNNDIFDLEIDMDNDPDEIIDQHGGPAPTPADGRGLKTDEIFSEDEDEMGGEDDTNRQSMDESELNEPKNEDDSSGIFSRILSNDDGDDEKDEQPLDMNSSQSESDNSHLDELVDEESESIEVDWESELQSQKKEQAAKNNGVEQGTTEERADDTTSAKTQETESENGNDQEDEQHVPQTQDDLPDEILDELDN